MAVNWSTLAYLPVYDVMAVPATFIPLASQPGIAPYDKRGIFDTDTIDVVAQDGSIYSDHRTHFYILESEFPVGPLQNDRVLIPFDCNGKPLGEFEIIDVNTNGGGETELTLRLWQAAKP
jgi:hypothetical protein